MTATTTRDYAAGRALIEEYAGALNVDLCFQNFSTEIADLPVSTDHPVALYCLRISTGKAAGCVAIRPLEGAVCEMKRLYVKSQYRGMHLGHRLVEAAIEQAARLGYTRIVLDTLPGMVPAQRLYASFGFQEIEGYYANPVAGVRYLARDL
ncbi:MAG: GNAT family N-acetyltransferase [Betaproteobacteria bacterium]|nr:GNAT family N-acetyltransferase [Betaproteobacteria bacterium]